METPFQLSNLTIRSNLLTSEYQEEILSCSVFDLRDLDRRRPNLDLKNRYDGRQKVEWRASLFWGSPVTCPGDEPSFDPGAWARGVDQLSEQPEIEAVLECLIAGEDAVPLDAATAAAARRLVSILSRSEFGLTPADVAERLARILGHPARLLEALENPRPPEESQ